VRFRAPLQIYLNHVKLEMTCGKEGGYVRAIARDLGDALGCFGHVRELRRVWSGRLMQRRRHAGPVGYARKPTLSTI
jgi:tRNA U55 pseudouridine synthase TruB